MSRCYELSYNLILCKMWRDEEREKDRQAAEIAKKIMKQQIKDEKSLCRKEKLEKVKRTLGFGR